MQQPLGIGNGLKTSPSFDFFKHEPKNQSLENLGGFISSQKSTFHERKPSFVANAKIFSTPKSTKNAMQSVGLRTVFEGSRGGNIFDTASRKSLHFRTYELSVNEVVDLVLNKPAFGFEGYRPKPTHKDLIQSPSFKQAKQKRITFAGEAANAKAGIPASSKYANQIDWALKPAT